LDSLTAQIPEGSTLIHLAGPVAGTFVAGLSLPWRLQIDGTSNVLQAAAAKRCARVVFGSSYHVYMSSPPSSIVDERTKLPEASLDAFGTSKLVAERLVHSFCKHSGMESVILRFGSVYGLGNCTNLMGEIFQCCRDNEKLEVWGAGKRTNHYVDQHDLADACVRALDVQPGLYNVLDPRRYTIREVCDIAQEVLGVTSVYRLDKAERPSFATIRSDAFMEATGWRPSSLTESFQRILPSISALKAA
jgi:nucleoside-diphosphate-sugar epimerase